MSGDLGDPSDSRDSDAVPGDVRHGDAVAMDVLEEDLSISSGQSASLKM